MASDPTPANVPGESVRLTRREVPIADENVASIYVGMTEGEARATAYVRTQLAGARPAPIQEEYSWEQRMTLDRWPWDMAAFERALDGLHQVHPDG